MTKEAQNCLLKTLEEPPEYACIILISSNENKLLNTIKSRCIRINFSSLKDEEILEYVNKNNIDNINKSMISFCDGSIGKMLKIKENEDVYVKVEELINDMQNKDLVEILNNSNTLYDSKDNIFLLLEYINILLLKSNKLSNINCVKYVEEAKKSLLSNSNYDMTIDHLLIRMWEEIARK